MPLRLHPLHSMRARPPRRPRVASYQPLEGCRFPIGDRAGSTSPRRSSVNASGGLDVWRSATGDRDPTHPRRALHPPPRRQWAPVSSVNTMLHGVRGFLRYSHIDGLTGADPAGLRPAAQGSTPMRPVLGGWTGWNSSGSRPGWPAVVVRDGETGSVRSTRRARCRAQRGDSSRSSRFSPCTTGARAYLLGINALRASEGAAVDPGAEPGSSQAQRPPRAGGGR